MFTVITLNYNDAFTTCEFVDRLVEYDSVDHVLIVDNCSTDDSLEVFKKYQNEKITVLANNRNAGYGAGNNFGIQYINDNWASKYVLLSNPDVVVDESALVGLEQFLEQNKEYAMVAPFMFNANMEKQKNTAMRIPGKWKYILSCSIILSKIFSFMHYRNIVNTAESVVQVGSLSGSMFMFRMEDMLNFGMYDEDIFLYGEEVVLGYKMKRAQKKVALLPRLSFVHKHSVSISKRYNTEIKKRRLMIKSQLHIIKKHYKANWLEYGMAYLLSKLSLIETWLLVKTEKIRKKQKSV